ncbi:MAG: hypothetical protein E8D46_10185 [Nitrospira sp.]|nr:MAG: hypothetical protein E8D46_10185 [Nitrospira sp.]
MADLIQFELPSMVEGVVLLSITNLALNPEHKPDEKELLIRDKLEEASGNTVYLAKVFRLLGEIPPAVFSENRDNFSELLTYLLSDLPRIFGGKDKIPDGLEDRMRLTLVSLRYASNKQLIIDMFNRPDSMIKALRDQSEALQIILGYYKEKSKEVRGAALLVLSDHKTSLENRLDAVNRYRAALEGPRIAEALINKYEAATKLTITATFKMLEAMERDKYTSEDLVAIKERLDEFTKVVEEIVSLARRLSGLFIF